MVRLQTTSRIHLCGLIFLALFLGSEKSSCQTIDTLWTKVDELPQFPGGVVKLTEYVNKSISKSIKRSILKNRARSIVFAPSIVSFVIEKDGTVSNIVLERSTDSLMAIEVHRIISLMPKWQPAMKGGKIVRSQVKLPVSFNFDASVSTNRFDYQGYDSGIILAFSYEKAFSLGTIGKYLNDGHGASIDFHFLDDDYDDDRLGLGIYSTWIRLWVEQPFERRNTIWQSGRRLSFNEVGVKLSYRIPFFENKQLEIYPTFQAAPSWYRPVERYSTDSGLGIGDLGFIYGFALRANWFFADTPNDNYHVLHFNICQKKYHMTAPMKGSMMTIGIGYTWFFFNG